MRDVALLAGKWYYLVYEIYIYVSYFGLIYSHFTHGNGSGYVIHYS